MNRSIIISLSLLMAACGGDNTASNVESPGSDESAKTELLKKGADVLQDKGPLRYFDVYLNGFHFYGGNMRAQMEAHHYVSRLNEDLHQAIIFDGNGRDAKVMGVEYIISERLFRDLPAEEKKLWHSHHYEVKSGTLIAPGLPDVAEHELMEQIVSTYGKTIHTWHTDQGRSLPVGIPMIMMGFTRDGQLDPALLRERDSRLNVATAEKKKNRSDIPEYEPLPGANAWEKGEVRQLVVTHKADSAKHQH